MAKALIATPALSDAATLYASEEASTDLAATNLQILPLSEKWRDDDLATVYMEADLGSAKTINLLALLGTNASSAATYRVRGATSQANLTAAPGYDSGAGQTHWPQNNLGEWDETSLIHVIATTETYRWWRIDISDAANPDGYYQAGRLYVAAAWQPSTGFAFGAGWQWTSDSTVRRSLGGKTWVDERASRRIATLRIPGLTVSEAEVTFADIMRLRGSKKDTLTLLDSSATNLQELSIYARIVNAQLITRLDPTNYTVLFDLEELL